MLISKKKIYLCMARCRMNQSQLAEKANLSRTMIYYVFNGKKCSAVTLGKIANALGVDPSDLIDDE